MRSNTVRYYVANELSLDLPKDEMMPLSKKEIVDLIASEHDLSKAKAAEVLDSFAQLIQKNITQEQGFVLPGVGRFSTVKRNARTGRNPQTGEAIKIAAATRVKFTAAKVLRDAVNKPAPKKKK